MASSSSLKASSSTSNCDGYNYHVFLSFRGEDTRQTFTGHLYANLVARGIHTFRDDEELEKGGDIASDLSRAIEESKIFIIIFSKRYADSKWCLNELAKIMDCKKEKGSVVLPVFYHVEPTDVRNQGGSFEDAFLEHAKDADQEKKKTIETWKNALKTAGNLSGYHLQNQSEAMFIRRICEDIVIRLNRMPLDMGYNIVGMDFHLKQLKSLIKVDIDEVLMVGIYGIGGIGKTTISKAIYNDISSQFDGSSFLGNVGGKCENVERKLLKLQKTLLQDILKCKRPKFNNISQGITEIKERLRSKRVLIVLDDVDNYKQLENLAGKYGWYGAKSIIIITTKDKHLLKQYEVNVVYEVQKLNHEKSAELFNWWAFKQNTPIPKFESLSDSIVKYADGLPIALEVLGGFLFEKSTEEWESELQKLQEMPDITVQSVLKVSYDKLDSREQGVFLDIACFFRGEDKNFVSRILGSDAEVGIKVLEDRCLITISENMLDMHDLLQQMGREVVRREGLKESHKYPQEPGKRSRLWDPKDVESVLTRNTGTKAIEGLFVEVSTSNQIQFSANFFAKMKSLRLLKVYDMIEDDFDDFVVDLPKDFEIPSFELRYLHFEGYPLQFLPRNFHAKNLVELDLIGSSIKQLWKENEILDKLKVIDLSYSNDLVEIPDFSSVPNLEILILEGCTRLQSLPRNFHKLEHLRSLSCKDCSKLKSFPEIKGNMSKLRELNLSKTAIIEVPSSIGHLKALQHLDLSFCESLRSLSESICNLSSLENLILARCSNLKGFPEINGDMENLKMLNLSFTGIEELPSSIGRLKALQHLDLSYCKSLRSLSESICNLSSLENLILAECSNLKGFPEINDDMENLKMLDLSFIGIEELPSSIGRLKALQHLDLCYCKSLRSLSESICNLSSLETLILARCSNLKGFPEINDDMENLERLDLRLTGIEELPSSIRHLKALQCLNLNGCTELVSLPDSICNLSSLETLILERCSNLKGFPEINDDMKNLKRLDLSFTGIEELPSSIGHLKALQHLNLKCCTELVSLPDSICNLSSLKTLDVRECPKLERVEVNLVGSLDLTCCILKQRVIWWSTNLRPYEVGGEVLNHHVSSLSSLVESCTRDYKGIGGDRFHLSALEVLSEGNFSPIQRRILSDIFRQSSLKSVSLRNFNLMEEGIPSDIWNLSSLVNLSLSNCSLTEGEILNHICHISSLQNLSLDGNHFSSIPAGISRLSNLRALNLSHCNKLQQIPELPSSLRDLNLSHCKKLQEIPELPLSLRFLDAHCSDGISSGSSLLSIRPLVNCFKSELIQGGWTSVGASSFESRESSIVMPRSSGILEGIRNQSMGSDVTIELPRNWYENNDLLGFALCFVCVPVLDDELNFCPLDFYCKLAIKGNDLLKDMDEVLFKSGCCCFKINDDSVSDLAWVIYYPKDAFKRLYHSKQWTHFMASFHSRRTFEVKECGIHPIYGCFKYQQNEECQRKLCLRGHAINELPFIDRPFELDSLCLRECQNLESLPSTICKLKSLTTLSCSGCSQLKIFPEILETLENLRELHLDGTAIEELPASIQHVRGLQYLNLAHCNNLVSLPQTICHLKSLVFLSCSGCSQLKSFPEILENMENLRKLYLDGTAIKKLPASMAHLRKLQDLHLRGMQCLEGLGAASIIQLSELRVLDLSHCQKLLQIPELPQSLRFLDAHGCPCLETLSSPSSSLGFSLFKCFKAAIEEFECGSYWSKEITVFIPGNNGIPEWISYKKKGFEIATELPENWWEDNNFLGFALCSVFVPLHIESKEDSRLKCEMNFPHNFEYPDGFVTEFWSVDELSFRRSYPCCHNGGESNKVWVAYYPKVAIENKHWSNEWRHLKASFYGEEVKVEECGLHLIYKTNILNKDSNAKRSLDDAENPHNKKSRLL